MVSPPPPRPPSPSPPSPLPLTPLSMWLCDQDHDSSEEESRKLVLELLDEYAFIRDRPLNDGESEADRQRALASARRRMTLSKRFRETMDRTKQERLDEYERKMQVHRRALGESLGDVFAAARETSSAGRLADQRGGSSSEEEPYSAAKAKEGPSSAAKVKEGQNSGAKAMEGPNLGAKAKEGPNSAAKAKSTGTSVAKGEQSAVKKVTKGASSKRKRAPRDSRSADWDPERAYEGAFEDDAADRDDSDDEDYVPDAEDDRTVTEARGARRGTRPRALFGNTSARKMMCLEGHGGSPGTQQDPASNHRGRVECNAPQDVIPEKLPNLRPEVKASADSSIDQDFIPEALHNTGPENDDYVDQLLGMNTIVPDADGAFFGEFSKRWRSWEFFHEQFDLFTANSYQRFSVRSTTSVEKRNKQILNSKKFRGKTKLPHLPENDEETRISDGEVGSKAGASISVDDTTASEKTYAQFLIPNSWGVYCKTSKCTHAIKQQKRGDGRRSHRVVRYTGCTAQVNATLQKQKGGKYYIFLKAKGSHNHALSPELWEYYAENRRIQDPLVLQAVGDMRQSGSSAKGILAYLRKRTGTLL